MANKSDLKNAVTKLKNKIINSLHEVEVDKLLEVAHLLNIRANPELIKKTDIYKNIDQRQLNSNAN